MSQSFSQALELYHFKSGHTEESNDAIYVKCQDMLCRLCALSRHSTAEVENSILGEIERVASIKWCVRENMHCLRDLIIGLTLNNRQHKLFYAIELVGNFVGEYSALPLVPFSDAVLQRVPALPHLSDVLFEVDFIPESLEVRSPDVKDTLLDALLDCYYDYLGFNDPFHTYIKSAAKTASAKKKEERSAMCSSSSDEADVDMGIERITTKQLDALWDSVISEKPRAPANFDRDHSRGRGRKRSAVDLPRPAIPMTIGVRNGDTSFEIPELEKRFSKKQRILPEDGRWVESDAPDPGTRFGPPWRGEEITRRNILERDPNFKFIMLVAGASHTNVERLYDEDSISAGMQRAIYKTASDAALREAAVDARKLEESIPQLKKRVFALTRYRDEIVTMQSSGLLEKAAKHRVAVAEYLKRVADRKARVEMSNLLGDGDGGPRVAYDIDFSVADRIVDAFSSDELGGLDLGRGTRSAPTTATPEALVAMILVGADALVAERFAALDGGWPGKSVARVLRTLFNGGWTNEFTTDAKAPASAAASAKEAAKLVNASRKALVTALRRLIVAKYVAVFDRTGDRKAILADLGDIRNVAADSLAVDGSALAQVIGSLRATSWQPWLAEAVALVDLLVTARTLLGARSSFSSPIEAYGRGFDPAPDDPADMFEENVAPARFERPAQTGIMEFAEGVDIPNYGVTLKLQVDAAVKMSQENGRTPLEIMHEAWLVGNDWDLPTVDVALTKSRGWNAGAYNTQNQLKAWTDALAWYEGLGGVLAGEFPARADGAPAAPRWSAVGAIEPPPNYSVGMRRLWELYAPELARAWGKVGAATLRINTAPFPETRPRGRARAGAERAEAARRKIVEAPLPELTHTERVVYTTVNGATPEASVRNPVSSFDSRAREAVLVLSASLLEAHLVLAAEQTAREFAKAEAVLAAAEERYAKVLRGEPVVRSAAYDHRRGWVEQPEHSGIVRLAEIVTFGISAAWSKLQRYVPELAQRVGIQFMQHDPQVRGDFAELVSVEMARVAHRWPKQYVQLGQRAHSQMDVVDIITRFRRNVVLRPTSWREGDDMLPAAAPAWPLPGRNAAGRVYPLTASMGPASQAHKDDLFLF